MIRFDDAGLIEVCIDGDRFEHVTNDTLVITDLPLPVYVRAFRSKVVVTIRSNGIVLYTTFEINRQARTVLSEGCLAPSVKEWSLHFLEFLGYVP